MSYILDTNVISEAIAKQPNPQVIDWLRSVNFQQVYLSIITVGEIKKGIEKLAESKRRQIIKSWFENDLFMQFEGRILSLDLPVILVWGELVGQLEKRGRKLAVLDSLIAATAKYHNYTLVTRNEKDFNDVNLTILNPF